MANHLWAPAPNFQVGDMVWLLRRNITTTRPCAKLDYTKLGPFRIYECINHVSYRLDLPPHYHIHDVFHVSLLEVYHPFVLPERQLPRPPPIELESGNEYEVKKSSTPSFYVENSITWYDGKDTWYLKLLGNLTTIWRMQPTEAVDDFHLCYPHKLAPSGSQH